MARAVPMGGAGSPSRTAASSTALPLDSPSPADFRRYATTGSAPLDGALGGGLPLGTTWLVEGEHGAGADVFALSVLQRLTGQASASGGGAPRPLILSGLRSPARVRREWAALFDDPSPEVNDLRSPNALREALRHLDLRRGDVLVLETPASLHRAGHDVIALVDDLAEAVAASEALLLLVHAAGSLPAELVNQLSETVDGILSFRWSNATTSCRRLLQVVKLRGLAPLLEHDQVPIFELTLERGIGYEVSRVKSVV